MSRIGAPVKAMTPTELARWYRNPGDLETWEDIASWFHRETGHLRPGKDKPIGFHQTEDVEPDCCMDAWLIWSEDKRDEAVRGLLARVTGLEVALKQAIEWPGEAGWKIRNEWRKALNP